VGWERAAGVHRVDDGPEGRVFGGAAAVAQFQQVSSSEVATAPMASRGAAS
jgi:hypothetical protein